MKVSDVVSELKDSIRDRGDRIVMFKGIPVMVSDVVEFLGALNQDLIVFEFQQAVISTPIFTVPEIYIHVTDEVHEG